MPDGNATATTNSGSPLPDLAFDELRARHETLAGHRTRRDQIAFDREEFLDETTSSGVEAGTPHRQLVPYLDGEFPVCHPVVATVTKLDAGCRECQRAVRDHLVRRV